MNITWEFICDGFHCNIIQHVNLVIFYVNVGNLHFQIDTNDHRSRDEKLLFGKPLQLMSDRMVINREKRLQQAKQTHLFEQKQTIIIVKYVSVTLVFETICANYMLIRCSHHYCPYPKVKNKFLLKSFINCLFSLIFSFSTKINSVAIVVFELLPLSNSHTKKKKS